jgi:2-oxoglutarate dehydrogenase E1 component
MLLPHGYEGQGPEHSSARLERFLILCAQDNMQICNVTTPAQYFHLLRRQAKQIEKKPLILMTPKSLLRLPEAKSFKEEFISGKFEEVLNDKTIQNEKNISKVILSSGKVFYDLNKYRSLNKIKNTAIIRLEQFYPFKKEMIQEIILSYKNAAKVVWVQEEPKNMGAWNFLQNRILEIISDKQKLQCISRPEGASPAVGSAKLSNQQQIDLVKEAFLI